MAGHQQPQALQGEDSALNKGPSRKGPWASWGQAGTVRRGRTVPGGLTTRRNLPEWDWASRVAVAMASCTWQHRGHSGHSRTHRPTPGWSPRCLSPAPRTSQNPRSYLLSVMAPLLLDRTPKCSGHTPPLLHSPPWLPGALGKQPENSLSAKESPSTHRMALAMPTASFRRVWGSMMPFLCSPGELLCIPQNPAQPTHPAMPTLSCP